MICICLCRSRELGDPPQQHISRALCDIRLRSPIQVKILDMEDEYWSRRIDCHTDPDEDLPADHEYHLTSTKLYYPARIFDIDGIRYIAYKSQPEETIEFDVQNWAPERDRADCFMQLTVCSSMLRPALSEDVTGADSVSDDDLPIDFIPDLNIRRTHIMGLTTRIAIRLEEQDGLINNMHVFVTEEMISDEESGDDSDYDEPDDRAIFTIEFPLLYLDEFHFASLMPKPFQYIYLRAALYPNCVAYFHSIDQLLSPFGLSHRYLVFKKLNYRSFYLCFLRDREGLDTKMWETCEMYHELIASKQSRHPSCVRSDMKYLLNHNLERFDVSRGYRPDTSGKSLLQLDQLLDDKFASNDLIEKLVNDVLHERGFISENFNIIEHEQRVADRMNPKRVAHILCTLQTLFTYTNYKTVLQLKLDERHARINEYYRQSRIHQRDFDQDSKQLTEINDALTIPSEAEARQAAKIEALKECIQCDTNPGKDVAANVLRRILEQTV